MFNSISLCPYLLPRGYLGITSNPSFSVKITNIAKNALLRKGARRSHPRVSAVGQRILNRLHYSAGIWARGGLSQILSREGGCAIPHSNVCIAFGTVAPQSATRCGSCWTGAFCPERVLPLLECSWGLCRYSSRAILNWCSIDSVTIACRRYPCSNLDLRTNVISMILFLLLCIPQHSLGEDTVVARRTRCSPYSVD